jgi:hypothetical protein
VKNNNEKKDLVEASFGNEDWIFFLKHFFKIVFRVENNVFNFR